MKRARDKRQLLLQWYEQMVLCFERTLTPEERTELDRWDKEWVDGGARIGTSDWPGWEKHIGKRPSGSAEKSQRRKSA